MSLFKRVSVLIAVVVLSGCMSCTVNTSNVPEKLLPDSSNSLSVPENENSVGSIAPTDDTIIDDSLKLSEADFIVDYCDFKITSETTVDELIEAFGHGNEDEYETNNYGYINTIENIQIFGLYYPDYENTAIRVIYHRNLSDDSAYITAIEMYDGSVRGLTVGDKQQKVIELYGTPDRKIVDGVLCRYLYFMGKKYLEIAMIDDETEVFYIMINYKSGFEGSVDQYAANQNAVDQYASDDTKTLPLFDTYGFDEVIKNNPIDQDFSSISFSGSTEQIIEENCKYRDYWENEMNAACDKLAGILTESDLAALVNAQESWKSYMEDNDSLRKSMFYERNYEGADAGSLAKAFVSVNQAKETRYRALELMEYLYRLAKEVDFVYTGWDFT